MNKNDGRGDARDEFFRHVEEYEVAAQDIVDGAKWFVKSGGNAGDYKLHAQTWLNRRAYEDGCELWRQHQQRITDRKAQESENVVDFDRRQSLPKTHFMRRQGAR